MSETARKRIAVAGESVGVWSTVAAVEVSGLELIPRPTQVLVPPASTRSVIPAGAVYVRVPSTLAAQACTVTSMPLVIPVTDGAVCAVEVPVAVLGRMVGTGAVGSTPRKARMPTELSAALPESEVKV
jgi:hypothetical protein